MTRFYTTTFHPRSLSSNVFEKYKKIASYKEIQFYTQQGVFKVDKGKLYKIIEKIDKPIMEHNMDGFTVIEDSNDYEIIYVTSQLPCEYFVKRNEVVKYALDNSTLVVVKDGEYFTDFYIEGDQGNKHISQDIVSFLSTLN